MAQNQGGAQNRLGELFVEFGSKGGKNLIQELSSIKIGFVGAAKVATAFTKPLINVGKQAASNAVNIAQTSEALATSYKEYQKLQVYLKKKNVSESLLGEVGNLRETLYSAFTGFGDLPGSISLGFNRIGKNVGNYQGTFESVLQLIDDIQAATKNMSKEQRLSVLSNFGLSSEWAYLFDRGDFNLREAGRTVPDKDIESLINLGEEISDLDNTLQQTNDTLKAAIGRKVVPYLTELNKTIDKASTGNKDSQKILGTMRDGAVAGASAGVAGGIGLAILLGSNPVGWAAGATLATIGAVAGAAGGNKYAKYRLNNKNINKNKPSGFAAPIDFSTLKPEKIYEDTPLNVNPEFVQGAAMPSSAQNITNYITISNENNISSDNPREVAKEIAQIDTQSINLSRFQIENLAGR